METGTRCISVNEPLMNGNEKKYLCDCIETGWISSEGSYVKRLEEGVAEYVGRKYGIAVCNGSVALDLAVESLCLSKGDEVIMPAFTIISCAAALVRRGIKPVLVDADAKTWNMDVTQIENKITQKTKAIMVVHIYGLPVDMDAVLEIATKYNLQIIEDAAEAQGLKYNEKMCGSFGDVSIMSFYPNKHITTGEGGMVLTDNKNIADKCYSYRNLCFKTERRFVHDKLGYNYRMSNIQAAIGVAQLEKINEHLELKRKMGLHYTGLLECNEKFDIPVTQTEYAENIYWVFGIVLKDTYDFSAADAMKQLEKYGVGCRPFFYPMHQQPVFQNMGLFQNESYPVAEKLAEKGFYIPSGLTLSDDDMDYVAKYVKKVVSEE